MEGKYEEEYLDVNCRFLREIGFQSHRLGKHRLRKRTENVNASSLDKLFDYLRFCLEQICADQEMESLLKALDGDYIQDLVEIL